ncbi:MAG: Fe-S cluster assembly protein HesB [Patescibacteria group bacterium]
MKKLTASTVARFQQKIISFYRLHKRTLPWRQTTDPYKITVAEIMLQQTQVERVVPKYNQWIKRWPGWPSLSRATNKQLLQMWSGLGYNRRAINLGKMAHAVVMYYNGKLPESENELQKLTGIGPYTARAILIFGFNKPLITIDTNIRRVIINEFHLSATLPRKKLESIAWKLLPRKKSRDWHNALMDYSRLQLPARISRIPALSKQSKFQGSIRQIRGEIIRQLLKKKSVSIPFITKWMGRTATDVLEAALQLQKDGIVRIINQLIFLE